MKTKKSFDSASLFWQLLLIIIGTQTVKATHIVGGVLNYTYLGGSSYTIRLKLYRDCGAGTASFPTNVIISVRGNNGATFSPSKDITMNLAGVSSVPGNTLPCAVNPNPLPCVQEGTYSITVNNLPATASGYHLYYQVSARNLSLSNINNACNCIGETYYAYIPGSSFNAACNCTATTNSNPSFSLLPPLFLCVNQPFTFSHFATDADGDSLSYSMYTPYNGDNGAGPLDPTYTNNIANFTPVTFLPGYTANNPLGVSNPFFINPITGVITATPNQVGQFVVGVKVTEWRNGVKLSETLRDVQFNVLNCPSPPPSLSIPNFSMSTGCTKTLQAGGITPASAVWTSIAPGSVGQYTNYLSCISACANVSISVQPNPPPYVLFKVCGTSTNCAGTNVCDTFRVDFVAPLSATILPSQPAICSGQTSSSLSAQAAGGATPYAYLWNNVNPSQTITVGAGTYNLKVTDATGCLPFYQTVIVSSFTVPISVDAGPTQTVCAQNPIVALSGTVQGATGGLWSGGSGTFSPSSAQTSNLFYIPSVTDLNAGSVKLYLTTTGNGGCPNKIDSVQIYFSSFTGSISISTSSVSCYGGANGSATAAVIGGLAPHTFTWSTLSTAVGSTVNALSAGIFSVTATNAIGCTAVQTLQITQATPLAITPTLNVPRCFSSSDGSISITINGGTLPYSTQWTAVTGSITGGNNIGQGTYTLVATDFNNCSASGIYTLTAPANIVLTSSITPVSCFAGANAAITVQVAGGSGPYSYSWSPTPGNATSLGNLSAGVYTVLVIDQHNCQLTQSFSISQPAALNLSVQATPPLCYMQSNGSLTASVSGGNAGYTYVWLPSNAVTSSISALPAGNYTLNITDSKACTTSTIITLTQPNALQLGVQQIKHVSCFGTNTGSISTQITGGTGPYNYTWTPNGGNQATLSFLSAGTYSLLAADQNNCSTTLSVQVNQPPILTAIISQTNVSCNTASNAIASVSVSGGAMPYTYHWMYGASTSSVNNQLPAAAQTVSVTDANGCSIIKTFTITQPGALNLVVTTTAVTCFGGNTGSSSAVVSGGTGPYTYLWQPNAVTNSQLNNVPAGNYTLTVSDANACSTFSFFQITQPPNLYATLSTTNETCYYLNNGAAQAIAIGGTAPYTYLWNGISGAGLKTGLSAGTYSLLLIDSKNCSMGQNYVITEPTAPAITFTNLVAVSCNGGNNAQVTAIGSGGQAPYSYNWNSGLSLSATASSLSAGSYTLVLSDNATCTTSAVQNITEPFPLNINTSVSSVLCNGGNNGAISLVTTGGTAPYQNLIFPGNIAGSNFTNLSPGTYTVFTTDANACASSLTISINQPISLTAVTNATPSTCLNNDGIATVSVTAGGTPPFTYTWLPMGGSTSVAAGLSAGSYTINISDNAGCSSTRIVNISDVSAANSSILSTTNVSCYGGNNGAISAGVSGGTGPTFSYSWFPNGGNSLVASGLSAGLYYLKVVDSNSCISISANASVTAPPQLAMYITTQTISCKGGNNGSATVSINGGTAPYTCTWLPSGSIGLQKSSLSAGIYTANISDAHACTGTGTFSIIEPATAVSIGLSSSPAKCYGAASGTIIATATGGIGPYQFTTQPGAYTSQTISTASAGTYTVTGKDINNCTGSATVQVIDPAVLSITVTNTSANCSSANGSATAQIVGGTAPYTYSWLPTAQTFSTASALFAGTYTAIVKDANACNLSTTVAVANNPAPALSTAILSTVSCYLGNNGSISAIVTGGTGPFNYSWTPSGATTSVASNLSSGTHTLFVSAANGCTAVTVSANLAQASALVTQISTQSVLCYGGSSGSAGISVSGGTAPYSYTWQPLSSNGPSIAGLPAANYTVQISDANSCNAATAFTITQPANPLSVAFTGIQAVKCFGASNGSIVAQASGGTAPYSYSWTALPATSATITNLAAGVYSLQVLDANACAGSNSTLVTQPAAALTLTVNTTAISCFGLSNGSATVTCSGGTAPYTYTWLAGGGTGSTTANLSTGNKQVLVVDNNACISSSIVTITQPAVLSANIQTIAASCSLANGNLMAQVTGGTAPYTFSWSPITASTSAIANIAPGTYSLLIKDANLCQYQTTKQLGAIPVPSLVITSFKNISCNGAANGSIAVQVNGGSAPYQYLWSAGNTASNSANTLSAGSYSIKIIDSKGCKDSVTKTLTEPTALTLDILNKKNAGCYNSSTGAATVLANGGTPAYSYFWSNFGTGLQQNALQAGTYTITAKDQQNCSAVRVLQITQPAALTLSVTNIEHPICNNSFGSATVAPAGGTAPYTFTWNTNPVQSSNSLLLVKAGNYSLQVKDAQLCSAGITVQLNQPQPVVTLPLNTDTICSGSAASFTAKASGGIGNYHFTWAPESAVTSGTYAPTPTTSTSYTVVAFDGNGCAGNDVVAFVNVYNFSRANIKLSAISPICPSAASVIDATVSGNTGPITYSWSPNVGTGFGPFVVKPEKSSKYYVDITSNCGVHYRDSVLVKVNQLPLPNFTSDTTQACTEGYVHFTDKSIATEIDDPILFWMWDFGDGEYSGSQHPEHLYITPGVYVPKLTISTDRGCSASNTASFEIQALKPPSASFSLTASNYNLPIEPITCINTSSGAVSYQWLYSDGAIFSEKNISYRPNVVGPVSITLVATSARGCKDTATIALNTTASLIFPTAFTPNQEQSSNGVYDQSSLNNDVFFPYTSGVINYHILIFDRWGELIFESHDILIGWDGYYKSKLCQQGVYNYTAEATLMDGSNFKQKGDVTLIR